MNRPFKVTPQPGFQIEVWYPDGTTGQIDMSRSVGHGVFAPLSDQVYFDTVHIGEFGQIAWSEDIEICSDAAYLEITGKFTPPLEHA